MSVLVQVLMLGGAGALVEGNIPAVVSTLGLNDEAKPQGIYGQTIHDNCERRPHFENGEFVYEFGS
jgi:Ni,Fe-hydrogenase I small subunit